MTNLRHELLLAGADANDDDTLLRFIQGQTFEDLIALYEPHLFDAKTAQWVALATTGGAVGNTKTSAVSVRDETADADDDTSSITSKLSLFDDYDDGLDALTEMTHTEADWMETSLDFRSVCDSRYGLEPYRALGQPDPVWLQHGVLRTVAGD